MAELTGTHPLLPSDDLARTLGFAQADSASTPHIALVGATYTITVAGHQTNGRFCVIDMHVPPGGGPPPHRHDFEETFILLEGEMQVKFRGQSSTLRAGDTINVPANAPHQFHNDSASPVRMICICSPAGTDEFFLEVGVPVPTRTSEGPKLDGPQMAEFLRKVREVSPKYHTELIPKI